MTTRRFRATTDGTTFEVDVEVANQTPTPGAGMVRVREVSAGADTSPAVGEPDPGPTAAKSARPDVGQSRSAAGGDDRRADDRVHARATRAATAEIGAALASFAVSSASPSEGTDGVRVALAAASATTPASAASAASVMAGMAATVPTAATVGTVAQAEEDAEAVARRALVVPDGATTWVFVEGEVWTVDVEPADQAARRPRAPAGAEGLMAPMPATVIRILVEPGREVRRGETLLLLEAMKMELPVRAPRDARIKALHCQAGQLVQPGVPLVELE